LSRRRRHALPPSGHHCRRHPGDDARELVDERLDTCLDDLARIRGELDVGSEELGVVEGFAALRLDEVVEPALEALGCRSPPGRDRFEGFEISDNQRSVTASRSAALLGKCR
jgi:hypothetical protein